MLHVIVRVLIEKHRHSQYVYFLGRAGHISSVSIKTRPNRLKWWRGVSPIIKRNNIERCLGEQDVTEKWTVKKLAIIRACRLFTFPLHLIVYDLFYISEGHSRELHEIVASVFFGAEPVCISFPQVGADLILQVKAWFKSHSGTREESKSGLLHQILVSAF